MASCLRNIGAKNYQSLLIGFQVTVENVRMIFWGTQGSSSSSSSSVVVVALVQCSLIIVDVTVDCMLTN